MTYDKWKTRIPDDTLGEPLEELSDEQQRADWEDNMQQRGKMTPTQYRTALERLGGNKMTDLEKLEIARGDLGAQAGSSVMVYECGGKVFIWLAPDKEEHALGCICEKCDPDGKYE